MAGTIIKTTALAAALFGVAAHSVVSPSISHAQSSETGGVQLTFGLGLRLEGQDNRELDPDDRDSSLETAADLSFGLLTETSGSRFTFNASGTLRNINTQDESIDGSDFVNPGFALSYSRENANSRLSLSGSFQERDLSGNDTVTEDGVSIDGEDTTQRRTVLEVRQDWGLSAPFGFGVLARNAITTRQGGAATGLGGDELNDTTRLTLGVNTRLNLSQVLRLNTELQYQVFDEEGTSGDRETILLDNRLTLDRPRGNVFYSLNFADTEDGQRVSTAIGRVLEFPRGTLSGEVGATRGSSNTVFLTAATGYDYVLSRGGLNFSLARDVGSGNQQDTERLSTRATAGYFHTLSPSSTARFDMNWTETEETDSDARSSNATFSATYIKELQRDWSLNAGYRHRFRDSNDTDSARSNTIFLELHRDFTTRF